MTAKDVTAKPRWLRLLWRGCHSRMAPRVTSALLRCKERIDGLALLQQNVTEHIQGTGPLLLLRILDCVCTSDAADK